nr:midkine isoform X1 [Cavia porcellus]
MSGRGGAGAARLPPGQPLPGVGAGLHHRRVGARQPGSGVWNSSANAGSLSPAPPPRPPTCARAFALPPPPGRLLRVLALQAAETAGPRDASLGCSIEASSSSPCSPCWRCPPRWPKKKDKGKKVSAGSECAEWTWGPCIPSSKDCGAGFREGTCGAQTQRIRCRVPCNWKKEFGADCKYKFDNWGACDGGSGTKARQGTLKKARYNAQCQETIRVTKSCAPKTKAKAKAKKGKGKD